MALTLEGRRLTEAHKLAQIELSALAAQQQVQIMRAMLDPFRLDATRTDWLAVALTAAEGHYHASGNLAEGYVTEYRKHELGELAPVVRGNFDALAVAGAFDNIVAYVKHLTGPHTPQRALELAIDRSIGLSQRTALAGGRELVTASALANRKSLGWRRVTDGNPCAFCAMLAGRGPVYRSAEDAGTVTGHKLGGKDYAKIRRLEALGHTGVREQVLAGVRRPRKGRATKRDIGEKYHNFCGCTVEEVFEDWMPTADEKRFQDLYLQASGDSLDEILASMRRNGGVNDAHISEGEVKKSSQGDGHSTDRSGDIGGQRTVPRSSTGGRGGGGNPPRRPAPPSDEWGDYPRPEGYRGDHDDPRLDAALAEKIIHGIRGARGKPVGGHGYGKTPVAKENTEFPQHWTDGDIAAAFYSVLEDGRREVTDSGTTQIAHVVDDVECALRFNRNHKPVEASVEFYPRRGGGTVKVRWIKGKRREKEMP